ncbi:MAG: hypothetical protein GXO40_05545 [Epsilonproteobacteria bacterium]|nr:hypothetical protein [Campylobacterota bacterium]
MSITLQTININQNMHIPAHIASEYLASVKFAEEFSKIIAKEKADQTKIKKVDKSTQIDESTVKEEEREHEKIIAEEMHHIDLKG